MKYVSKKEVSEAIKIKQMELEMQRDIEEKGQTREETRTTDRKRKLANLACLAEHRISLLLLLSADLILTF